MPTYSPVSQNGDEAWERHPLMSHKILPYRNLRDSRQRVDNNVPSSKPLICGRTQSSRASASTIAIISSRQVSSRDPAITLNGPVWYQTF